MMAEQKRDLTAIAKAVADMPRRDNTAYHQAMARAREAFAEAEAALGGPVTMKVKVKTKGSGKADAKANTKTSPKSGYSTEKYVVKFVFTREE
jgi:Flp pilus assembly protein TadG